MMRYLAVGIIWLACLVQPGVAQATSQEKSVSPPPKLNKDYGGYGYGWDTGDYMVLLGHMAGGLNPVYSSGPHVHFEGLGRPPSPKRVALAVRGPKRTHRVVMEYLPESSVRNFSHLPIRLRGSDFSVYFFQSAEERELARLNRTGAALAASLLKIRGVDQLDMYNGALVLGIRPAFTWEEILPQVTTVMGAVLEGSTPAGINPPLPTRPERVKVVPAGEQIGSTQHFYLSQQITQREIIMLSMDHKDFPNDWPLAGELEKELTRKIGQVTKVDRLFFEPYQIGLVLEGRQTWDHALRQRVIRVIQEVLASYNAAQAAGH